MPDLAAPIVAVTVYPDRARVTRRGRVTATAGEQRIALTDLPLHLDADSVRVAGRGAATVLGVDVGVRRNPRAADPAIAALENERRELADAVAAVEDALAVEDAKTRFLERVAMRTSATLSHDAAGGAGRAAAYAEDMGARLAEVRRRKRDLRRERTDREEELAAVERELAQRAGQGEPDRQAISVLVDAAADGEVELEISYVVFGASWSSTYDVRLVEEQLTVTWYGLVSQHTGEDWPECDLALSTARPSGSLRVPELSPWYLDRYRPPQPVRQRSMPAPGSPPMPMAVRASADMTFAAAEAAPIQEKAAVVEQGPVAATYRPSRPVAVPADGEVHRATVAVLDMDAVLDYVTVPLLAEEAHLRATVTNTSPHTLLPGRAAVFHGAEFVGATNLESWAPGEEVELALGVDDRVRVERELVRRTAGRGLTSNRREAAYKITVANHTPRAARLTVQDQVPVSRDEAVNVKDVHADPRPDEVTDLGEVTWKFELKPGQDRELTLGFRVDVGRGVELAGWRD